MDYFLGKKPVGATTDSKVDLGDIVRDIDELMILNDEAHHVHDPKLAWFKSIEDIHNRLLQKGSELTLQVDVTATPKHNNGAIFVQTVSDYPLVEAISQNVVKHPVLPNAESRAKLDERQSVKYTEKYADYLELGVIEWRKAAEAHEKMGKKAILFVMTDNTQNCDEVAAKSEGVELERQPMGAGTKPKAPLVIEVDKTNVNKDIDALDIEIPILTRRIYREYTNLTDLDVTQLDFSPVTYQAFGEAEIREIVFKDMTTGEVTHTTVMDSNGVADYRSVVGYFAETIRFL